MSKKWYGSIDNRLEEGHIYNDDKLIHEGDDINVYYWSDVHCKYISRVIDQKHIFVKSYYVIADREAGSYSNQWLYFKSLREQESYLNEWYRTHPEDAASYERCVGHPYEFVNLDTIEEQDTTEEWVFRYGHWNTVRRYDLNSIKECLERTKKDTKSGEPSEGLMRYYLGLNDEEFKKLKEKGCFIKYRRIQEGLSFGTNIRRYYYDYEF